MKTRSYTFVPTRWSLIANARSADQPHARRALEELCDAYWFPVYAFVRRSGKSREDAEDLTQGFFASVIEKDTLAKADPERGRFRTFVIACLKRHLGKEHQKATAAKRGGGQPLVRIDTDEAEERYVVELRDDLTPEKLFERMLAIEIFLGADSEVAAEWQAEGKGELFTALRDKLDDEGSGGKTYPALSAEFNIPEGTLKSHGSRLRKHLRRTVRDRVAETLVRPEDVDEEIAILLQCI